MGEQEPMALPVKMEVAIMETVPVVQPELLLAAKTAEPVVAEVLKGRITEQREEWELEELQEVLEERVAIQVVLADVPQVRVVMGQMDLQEMQALKVAEGMAVQ